jgi:hypothetical protein
MTLAPEPPLDGAARPVAGDQQNPGVQPGEFVINLCAVAVPIAIPQPRAPQLTRFRFFLSHCWEEGRRRYRLHMGYFATAAEAQKWLDVLRRIYPSAYVSTAPAVRPDLLSNTEVLRILELPRVDGLDATANEPVPSLRAAPVASPVERRDVKDGAPARTSERQSGSSLQKSLEALRTSEFGMQGDDELNSTGVRHLQVEVQNVRPIGRKSQGPSSRAPRRS